MNKELVEQHLPLVRTAAANKFKTTPGNVSYDELYSWGVDGLIDAVESFNPKRGVRFETYAAYRILGAMRDGMRQADWLPHSHREKARRDPSYRPLEVCSLESPVLGIESDKPVYLRAALADKQQPQPSNRVECEILRDLLLKCLPRLDRRILLLYFYGGYPMSEVGQIVGLCESRISQRLKRILQHLRKRFAGREEDFRLN